MRLRAQRDTTAEALATPELSSRYDNYYMQEPVRALGFD